VREQYLSNPYAGLHFIPFNQQVSALIRLVWYIQVFIGVGSNVRAARMGSFDTHVYIRHEAQRATTTTQR
jgi:hypothetical protein